MSAEAEQIVDLYQRHVRAYDRLRGRSLFEKSWLDAFVALLPENASVLDIGCGMAEPIARYLCERGCRVTGVDSSPGMIDLCRERLPEHVWTVADMRALSLGRPFDGLLVWDSFFHLSPDDQRRMFPVFRRHAGLRSTLMFTSGPSHGVAIGSFEGEPLYHASLNAGEYRTLLSDNGFAVVSHIAEDKNCNGHTVWLARRV